MRLRRKVVLLLMLKRSRERARYPREEVCGDSVPSRFLLVLAGLVPRCGWDVLRMRFRMRELAVHLLGFPIHGDAQVRVRNCNLDNKFIRWRVGVFASKEERFATIRSHRRLRRFATTLWPVCNQDEVASAQKPAFHVLGLPICGGTQVRVRCCILDGNFVRKKRLPAYQNCRIC